MSAPPKERNEAFRESLFFCAVPSCFIEQAINVHHINQIKSYHRPENLISLCPTYRAHYHRSRFDPKSVCELRRYKRLLQEYVPGRKRTLNEILLALDAHYQTGQFKEMEEAIYILFKVLKRDKRQNSFALIGQLSKYIGEIEIQRGKAGVASKHLIQASYI